MEQDRPLIGEALRASVAQPIDYDRMNREYPKQKAALTRAINSHDPNRVVETTRATVRVWNEIGSWPDEWHRWQIAVDDALGYGQSIDIRDLA